MKFKVEAEIQWGLRVGSQRNALFATFCSSQPLRLLAVRGSVTSLLIQ